MPLELKVPEVGESITEVLIAKWRKSPGDQIAKDEGIVELESDKATVDLPAPVDGTLSKLLKQAGQTAAVGEVIGYMLAADEAPQEAAADATTPTVAVEKRRGQTAIGSVQPAEKPAVVPIPASAPKDGAAPVVMPAAERVLAEKGIAADKVAGTGPGGRVLKEDALRATTSVATPPSTPVQTRSTSTAASAVKPAPPAEPREIARPAPKPAVIAEKAGFALPPANRGNREEEIVAISPIRRRIAERLVEAQQTAALLTTFNEVDMSDVMSLRAKHKDAYVQRYGIKLGFMSFFVKASIDALKLVPQVNAEVRDPHIVYRHYYDIGIAVGGGKGLVVPVLRNAELMSFGEIELAIAEYGRRAADNKLKLEELQGGTFTISNGGVYGSLLSTPIVNPPQSGILGLHAIQDRPVARNGQVVIRPMMYIALTYDHRIVDGREAVTFLKRIKDTIEDPARLFLEV
jgi:2-oxoglutarate dehydrogenase E2 component (dihydrolipoamide succinyltransferase)